MASDPPSASGSADGRFEFLAESMPEKIFAATVQGEISFLNDQWSRYLGCPAQEIMERGWREFIHDDDLEEKARRWRSSMATGQPFECEHRLRRHDGSYRWHLSRAHPMRQSDGTISVWIGSNIDIDDLKLAHLELRRQQEELGAALRAAEHAREQAETAGRAKDQFLAVLSHELRTPLTPILMAVSATAATPDLPEHVRAALEMIQRNVKIEARLIEDLLDLTRITRNTVHLDLAPMDLHTAVQAAVEICDSDFRKKKQLLRMDLAATSTRLDGDFNRLQQVFWNLIKNAVKFTPEEGIISVRSYNEGDKICVEVADSGIGIDADILASIFNPFEQGNQSFARRYGGLGLGLAISRATIEAHGGRILVHSEGKDRGATFTVELSSLAP